MIGRRGVMAGSVAALAMAGAARASTSVLGTAEPVTSLPPGSEAPQLNDVVAPGWRRDVLIRWGDAVLPSAPPFRPGEVTLAAASQQFGWDAIIAGLVKMPPADDGVRRLLMVVTHPDVEMRMAFPRGRGAATVAGKMQGASVLNLAMQNGRWVVVAGGYQSRRITDGTLCRIAGPAAASVGQTVQGVLAPSIGGVTPWNTVLLPEGHTAGWIRRLAGHAPGFGSPTVGAGFGWVVELDAANPMSFPVKRTALGRLPRAGVACGLAADGSAVVFMSEDGPMGRLFRFKGAAPAGTGEGALEAGTLAVAVIEHSHIVWHDLPAGLPSLTATASAGRRGSGFDAPSGMAIAPDGTLYLACRGNPGRGISQIDPLNPRAGNGAGHILAFAPEGGDPGARRFAGRVVLLGGNPAHDSSSRYAPGSTAWLRAPSTLDLDGSGRLLIGTDQRGAVTDTADGLFAMHPHGGLDLLYSAPVGGAVGGAAADPAGKTLFTVARHPGGTREADFADPATRWPTVRPGMPPQTTMVSLAPD
ncbi:PhoX family phosphatase [Acidiphilium sp. PM]|jgi:secreted PhoX family phosphatase|uniref:PhoX family protein n=1 Tax=Acidiphilium TaxID=522 RepID=UPI0002145969|nr:alkaline phosphatase PhoX [Acidiphilium sp. PM]EGO96572.1 Phosphatase-like protein [Acidiphilium sp. PM]